MRNLLYILLLSPFLLAGQANQPYFAARAQTSDAPGDLGGDLYRLTLTITDETAVYDGLDIVGDSTFYYISPSTVPGEDINLFPVINIVLAFAGQVTVDVRDIASAGPPQVGSNVICEASEQGLFAYVSGAGDPINQAISDYNMKRINIEFPTGGGTANHVWAIAASPDTSTITTPVEGDIAYISTDSVWFRDSLAWLFFSGGGGGSTETADGLTILGDGGGTPFYVNTDSLHTKQVTFDIQSPALIPCGLSSDNFTWLGKVVDDSIRVGDDISSLIDEVSEAAISIVGVTEFDGYASVQMNGTLSAGFYLPEVQYKGVTLWSEAIVVETQTCGTVTSVALSLPSDFSISGSPVTSSGTLSGTWATQAANTVLAGPATGSPATPSFRPLVGADVTAAGGALGTGAANQLAYWSGSNTLTGSANLTYSSNILALGGTAGALQLGATTAPVNSAGRAYFSIGDNWFHGMNGTQDFPFAKAATATFTTGSVLFAGTNGQVQQDNANFFWDDTGNNLGIATTSPRERVDIASGYGIHIPRKRTWSQAVDAPDIGHMVIDTNAQEVTLLIADHDQADREREWIELGRAITKQFEYEGKLYWGQYTKSSTLSPDSAIFIIGGPSNLSSEWHDRSSSGLNGGDGYLIFSDIASGRMYFSNEYARALAAEVVLDQATLNTEAGLCDFNPVDSTISNSYYAQNFGSFDYYIFYYPGGDITTGYYTSTYAAGIEIVPEIDSVRFYVRHKVNNNRIEVGQVKLQGHPFKGIWMGAETGTTRYSTLTLVKRFRSIDSLNLSTAGPERAYASLKETGTTSLSGTASFTKVTGLEAGFSSNVTLTDSTITVTNAGDYRVRFNFPVQIDAAAGTWAVVLKVYQNAGAIPQSRGAFQIVTGAAEIWEGTISGEALITASAADVFSLQYTATSGASYTLNPGSFTIEKL